MPEYIGCYVDNGHRVFNQGPMAYGYTVFTCAGACAAVSTTHMALQHGGWCCCGSAEDLGHAPYIQTPDSECGAPSPQFGSSESPQR
eukprot:912989-Pyramimonas_sp.AAC.1